MKKLALTLMALVCALCCAFGLAACGEKNGSGEENNLGGNAGNDLGSNGENNLGGNGETVTGKTVAGKTFAYHDVVREGTAEGTDTDLEEYKTRMSSMGIIITFGTDNSVHVRQGVNTTTTLIEQEGTYAEDGETVTLTIATTTMNGTPVPGDVDPMVCKYDGTDFKMPVGGSSSGAGSTQTSIVYYVVLREQAA